MEELCEYKDMYGIYWRIKQIRPSYKLLLNRKTNMLELFDTNFGGKCMTFSFPIYPNILDKINATRTENASQIFRKIEQDNLKNDQKTLENAKYMAKQLFF